MDAAARKMIERGMQMLVISARAEIARPVEELFEYMSDMTRSTEWCVAMKAVRQTEGRGVHVGAEYSADEKPSFFPVRSRYRLEKVEFPRRLVWHYSNFLMHGTGSYVLEQRGEVTLVEHRNEVALRGPAKLLEPVFRRLGNRSLAQQLADLKRLKEGPPRVGGPS